MEKSEWILCPICRNKSRIKVCEDAAEQNKRLG